MRLAAAILLTLAGTALIVWHYSPKKASVVQQLPADSNVAIELHPAQAKTEEQPQPKSSETHRTPNDTVKPAAPTHDNARLNDVNARIQELEKELSSLAQDQRQAMTNAQNYQSSLQAQKAGSAFGLEQQIQDVNAAIVDLQNQVAQVRETPTTDLAGQNLQIQNLETQIANQIVLRDQLTSQKRALRATTDVATARGDQEFREESQSMMSERQAIEHELNELRAEAAFWKQRSQENTTSSQ